MKKLQGYSLLCLCLEYRRKIYIFKGTNIRETMSKDWISTLHLGLNVKYIVAKLGLKIRYASYWALFTGYCREARSWNPVLWKISRERISRMRILKYEYVCYVSNFPEYMWFLIIKMPRVFLLLWFLLGYKTGGTIIHVKENYFQF